MAAITVRNLTIGAGRPKICVPLTARTREELAQEAGRLKRTPWDLAEWRADCFDGLTKPGAVTETLSFLRESLGDRPLLFTIRTRAEGGNADPGSEAYRALTLTAAESGLADLVDAELSAGHETFSAVVQAVHAHGAFVVGSRHDFNKTPAREELVESLCRMQDLGADLVKYAVMPQSARDVLTLFDATLTMRETRPGTPVITMSMGDLGVLSRLGGGLFGSCITFGTAGRASAPGQLPAETLEKILALLPELT